MLGCMNIEHDRKLVQLYNLIVGTNMLVLNSGAKFDLLEHGCKLLLVL
jgi:hypothetical protein